MDRYSIDVSVANHIGRIRHPQIYPLEGLVGIVNNLCRNDAITVDEYILLRKENEIFHGSILDATLQTDEHVRLRKLSL